MPDLFRYGFNNGLVTAKDRRDLSNGECQNATGIEYMPGDPARAFKAKGRTEFGDTAEASIVKGLYLAQFDSGTNQLFSVAGTTLYAAPSPGATGTFAAFGSLGALNSSVTHLTGAHWDDRHYISDGYGFDTGTNGNLVIESDGTSYRMGMSSPQVKPAVTLGTTATVFTVTGNSSSSGWVDQADAQTDDEKFASATLSTATNVNEIWTFDSADHDGLKLTVRWGLGGIQIRDSEYGRDDLNLGGGGESGEEADFNVDVKIEYSEDGTTYTDLVDRSGIVGAVSKTTEQVTLSMAGAAIVKVRFTLTYNSGSTPATLRVYLAGSASAGSDTVATAAADGVIYAIGEFDDNTGKYSPPGPESNSVAPDGSTHTYVTVPLPSAAQNARTTHFVVYRTPNGGSTDQLGRVGFVPKTESSFIDDFDTYDTDIQPVPLISLISIGQTQGNPLTFFRDQEPPVFRHLNQFQGHLVATTLDKPRQLAYSVQGRPESWPEIYRYSKIPLPDNDRLIGTMTIGETLIVGGEGVIVRMRGLPTVDSNVLSNIGAEQMEGVPGFVSETGFTPVEVGGEPMGAWVSHVGIYITNGVTARRLTEEQDWSSVVSVSDLSSCVLRWLPDQRQLRFDYDSDGGGTNDRYLLLHLDPTHQKSSGSPKITGPHYSQSNDLVRGFISGVERIYSAHATDGKVYLERSGSTDASSSFSGTQVPLDVTGGRLYEGDQRTFIKQAAIYHTDFGTGETATITWTSGSDFSNEEAITKSPSLSSQKEDLMWIGRSGQWHEIRVQHTGAASSGAALGDIRAEGRRMGQTGERVAV